MIEVLDIGDAATASQILQIQRAAYAIEAELIGFEGIASCEPVPFARLSPGGPA